MAITPFDLDSKVINLWPTFFIPVCAIFHAGSSKQSTLKHLFTRNNLMLMPQ